MECDNNQVPKIIDQAHKIKLATHLKLICRAKDVKSSSSYLRKSPYC